MMALPRLSASVQLLEAVQAHDRSAVMAVLSVFQSELNVRDVSSALIEAASEGWKDMVEVLLPHVQDPHRHILAIKAAIIHERAEVVQVLRHLVPPNQIEQLLCMAQTAPIMQELIPIVPPSHQHLLEGCLLAELEDRQTKNSEMIDVLLPHVSRPLNIKFLLGAVTSKQVFKVDVLVVQYSLEELDLSLRLLNKSGALSIGPPSATLLHLDAYVSKKRLLQEVPVEGHLAPRSKM